jgi:hypothetical protein
LFTSFFKALRSVGILRVFELPGFLSFGREGAMDSDMFSTVSSGLLTVVSASGGLGMGVSFSGSLEITVLSRVPSSLSGLKL